MAEQYYKSRHTGQQIDDAVDAVGNKADVINIGGAKKLAMSEAPFASLQSTSQIADSSAENNKMWWSTDGGKLKYKQNGVVYVLSDTPPYILYYCDDKVYKWNGNGFTAMSSGEGGTGNYPPASGIPASDLEGNIPASKLASAVQTSLGKADSAYQKPSSGIPNSDLAGNITYSKLAGSIPASKFAAAVQTALGLASTSVQPAALNELFSAIVYDQTTHRYNFYGKGDTSHTTPLAYIDAAQLVGIADDLNTNDASVALSAKQGYLLRTAIDSLLTALANLAFGGEKPTMPWQSVEETYVQDGLVFHLDGINKGGVSGQWTDLIGGVDFPNHGATELENGWQFDGVNDWMGYSDSTKALSFYGDSCTIEVCFEDSKINQGAGSHDAGMFLCAMGASPNKGTNATNAIYVNTVYNGNGTRYINGVYVGSTDSVWKDQLIDTIAKNTLSINKVRAFHNGVALETQNANHWASINASRTIGAQYHTNGSMTEFCSGKIFSIRVYNRILSEAEILQNQRVDNARFNLGLTLPE